MQEALGLGDAVAVDQDADDADPERVHQHRQRDRREEQHHLVPDRPAVEYGEDVGEAHDREEVAQARAGLGHLQLVDSEVDDVAVEEHRHRGELHQRHADLRGDELQRGVDLPVEELRQRQHEDEVQHRGPEDDAARPAEARQDQPGDPDDQRVEDNVGDLHQVAEERDGQRQRDDRDPGPAVGDRPLVGRHVLQLAQEHVEGQAGDHRPVAELRLMKAAIGKAAASTTNVTPTEWLRLPLVPVIVIG